MPLLKLSTTIGCFLIIAPTILAQGSLTPSAAPGPTMKTLDEMEPRTAITSLPYTISASGSYYLATNLSVTSIDSGITVSASNVTIDLNGLLLTGDSSSLTGIIASGTPSAIHIKNGIISGWGSGGIDLTGATRCLIKNVTVNNCSGIGVQLPENSTLQHSHILSNGGDGVETVGSDTFILNNTISNNTRGIDLTNGGATVKNNKCSSNSNRGIYVNSDENTVSNNRTIGNSIGFEVTGSNNLIQNNYTIRNGSTAESNQVLTATETNNNKYNLLISDIPETLDRSCNAALTNNVVNSQLNEDGITIDADNVTLDLAGFSIIGSGNAGGAPNTTATSETTIAEYIGTGVSSDDGIAVQGTQENITIKNGFIIAWGGNGIYAISTDYSKFEDLHFSFNDEDGIIAGDSCVITQCVAHANGTDGIDTGEGAVLTHCTSTQNGGDGIDASSSSVVRHCASYENETDGFNLALGCVVTDCSAKNNDYHGFDLSLGVVCRGNNAHNNGSSTSDGASPPSPVTVNAGFDLSGSCILESCHAVSNTGHGIRAFSNAHISKCSVNDNSFDGIRISSTDSVVLDNSIANNQVHGIQSTTSGSLIIGNQVTGSTYDNYNLHSSCSYGPVINLSGVDDISGTSGSEHPYANFEH